MKLDVSEQIFGISWNTRCHENPFGGNRTFPCGETEGQTDKHDDDNSRFTQFWERVEKCFVTSDIWVSHYMNTCNKQTTQTMIRNYGIDAKIAMW